MPGIGEPSSNSLSVAKLALSIKQLRAETRGIGLLESEPLAVIGMSCRFPGGADSPQEFWQNLIQGRESIREMPESRWKPDPLLTPVLRRGGYLEEVDTFDTDFFGITAREAAYIDPQHRMMLEMAWNALYDAGIPPERLSGSATGVWSALSSTDYFRMQLRDIRQLGSYIAMGAAHCMASGEISFLLNLHGPSTVVDTACSSSLVAVHMASQSLRNRECDVAIVTASNLKLLPDEVIVYAKLGMLASDGHTKAFDERADGLVPGEGSGAVILKRFADALADGNRIRAVIRGSAINHNGRTTVLSAPSGLAQRQVIQTALRNACVSAEDITYIEAHGTGTSLGDPIEVEALREAYDKPDGQTCVIGAVKTNVGHLEAAAGIAGLIKVILAFENSEIPASLNWHQLNSRINLEGSRFRLAHERTPWPRNARPRLAGVSSFGISGTNAHLVLEEAPVQPVPRRDWPEMNVLVISARSAEALKASADRFAQLLRTSTSSAGAISASAATHRSHLSHRLGVVGSSSIALATELEAFVAGSKTEATYIGTCNPSDPTRLVFIYPDHLSISPSVVLELVRQDAKAFELMEEMDGIIAPVVGCSVIEKLQSENLADRISSEQVAQLKTFVLQIALATVLSSHGISPARAAGFGVGELAAAYANGEAKLEDAARLACRYTPAKLDPSATVDALLTQGYRSFIEIGPSTSFSDQIAQRAELGKIKVRCHAAVRDGQPGERALAELIADLYAQGAHIDWRQIYRGSVPVASLPAYPWQRRRLWFEEAGSDVESDALVRRLQLRDSTDRYRLIVEHVETCVREVMELEPSHAIRHDQPLQEVGLDSLMAVMLRNMLQVSLGRQMASSFALENSTIESMSKYVEAVLSSDDLAGSSNGPNSMREEIRL